MIPGMRPMKPWKRPLAFAAVAAIVATAVTLADRSASASAAAVLRRDKAFKLHSGARAFQASVPVKPADLVLRNGKIVTVDEAKPEAQAIAINGDTITALGSNQEIQRYVSP